MKATQTCDVQH